MVTVLFALWLRRLTWYCISANNVQNDLTTSSDDIKRHLQLIQEVRDRAKIISSKADQKMIRTSKAKNPPTQYKCGDSVIIRRFSSSAKRKSAKEKQQRIVTGEILKHSSKSETYKVRYIIDEQNHEEWFSVSDLTSLTRQEEKDRHQNDPQGILNKVIVR